MNIEEVMGVDPSAIALDRALREAVRAKYPNIDVSMTCSGPVDGYEISLHFNIYGIVELSRQKLMMTRTSTSAVFDYVMREVENLIVQMKEDASK